MLAGYKYKRQKTTNKLAHFPISSHEFLTSHLLCHFWMICLPFPPPKSSVLFYLPRDELPVSKMQVSGLQLLCHPPPLFFFCPWLTDTGKWFHSHANPARAPVIHTANYTSGLGTLTCWHHTGILAWGGQGGVERGVCIPAGKGERGGGASVCQANLIGRIKPEVRQSPEKYIFSGVGGCINIWTTGFHVSQINRKH